MGCSTFRPEPFTEREAYLWSIEQAAFRPHRQWFNGSLYEVDRGEFVTSLHTMEAAFQWSEKRVRTFMRRMLRAGKWAKRGAHSGAKAPTVLSVCNYDSFQFPVLGEGERSGERAAQVGAKTGRSEGEQQKQTKNNSKQSESFEEDAIALIEPGMLESALAAWSQFATMKHWAPVQPTLPLSGKRRRGLSQILADHGIDGWVAGLQRAADSQVLGGPDPPAWFNFGFVCNQDNFTKLHEGNYDRAFSKSSGKSQANAWLVARQNLISGHL